MIQVHSAEIGSLQRNLREIRPSQVCPNNIRVIQL